jgi:signal peptidase II
MSADSGTGAPASRPALLWGPLTRFGLAVAVLAAAIDQAVKLWLLFAFDLEGRGNVPLTPFFELALARNTGISYGLFPQQGPLGQWALLALKLIAVILLWIWLSRASTRLTALALGLIIGGAIGNAIDRIAYGWVADFALFQVSTAGWVGPDWMPDHGIWPWIPGYWVLSNGVWLYRWYVFNLADVAIVAGVIGLLYETILVRQPGSAAKAP